MCKRFANALLAVAASVLLLACAVPATRLDAQWVNPEYVGKKAVVIGSNNSAHDICKALYENGVDVTMVQRSSTHIVWH